MVPPFAATWPELDCGMLQSQRKAHNRWADHSRKRTLTAEQFDATSHVAFCNFRFLLLHRRTKADAARQILFFKQAPTTRGPSVFLALRGDRSLLHRL